MSWTFEVAPGGEYYDQASHTWVITKIRRADTVTSMVPFIQLLSFIVYPPV